MRLALRITLVLSILIGLLGGYHWLLIDRLLLAPGWTGAWVAPVKWAIIGGALAMPAALIGERFFDPRHIRIPLIWPAMLWMGVSFMLFSGIVVTGVLHTIVPSSLVDLIVARLPFTPPPFSQSRVLFILALVAPLASFGVWRALHPVIRRLQISILNWPTALDGLRIIQLSDIHIGPILTRRNAAYLTERTNDLEPDLIVVTGDLVDGSTEHLADEVAPFSELRSELGTFFVTGNHDFYSGATPWCEAVESLGMQVLRNRSVVISRDGASFNLVGVDDHRGASMRGGGGGENLDAALSAIREELPLILLAHDPATFTEASRRGIDLQISGHTHGGQIWPFRYLVRLSTQWVAGLYRVGRSQIYVSRGTGFWGPPLRVGAPSEITELTIRRA